MKDHIVFDLETQHEFSEVGGRDYPHLLKVSVVGSYSYLKEVVIKTLPACDLMEDVTNVLGHRLSLDSIAQATLGTQKSGHGLDAIRYFREGNMEKLKSYCLDDVRITRDIFEYGKKHGNVKYSSKYSPDLNAVPVDWKQYVSPSSEPIFAPAASSSQEDAPAVNRETGN